MAWLYAPGLEDLNLDSSLPSGTPTEPWLTLSGKPSQRPLSWRGWKTRPWIGRLSGTISRPSMAGHGVALWISYLAATRASHSAQQGSVSERVIRATSGLNLPDSFEKSNPRSSSARTSTLTFDLDLPKFSESFEDLVTRLRRDSSARLRWGRRTPPNVSSSSLTLVPNEGGGNWPTPDAAGSNPTSRRGANRRGGAP